VTATYLEQFEAFTGNGGASGSAWLGGLRQSGADRLRTVGLPTGREEDWRFTNVAAITAASFRLSEPDVSGVGLDALGSLLYDLPGSSRLIFINGRFAPALSTITELPGGARLRNLAGALTAEAELLGLHLGRYARSDRNGFTALNTAFLKDGVFLHVPADVILESPVQVLFLTDQRADGAAIYPRNFYCLERGSRAEIIETYGSLGDHRSLTVAVTEAVVMPNASLTHTKVQRESERSFHVATTHLHQERDSRVESHSVSLGAAVCRNDLDLVLGGSGIESTLLGLYLGRGSQEVDNHTSILHAHPNCSTREVYKGVLDGAAHGIFNGKVYVTPEAQKTDAKQTNRNLLLSDRARIDTKPQLEIFADDVKCTHGATVGSLDPVAMFYLKSRGIPAEPARRLLTYAFAAEVLEEIPAVPVRIALERLLRDRFEAPAG
jgi:Fe-S cluster assembly protein SufD